MSTLIAASTLTIGMVANAQSSGLQDSGPAGTVPVSDEQLATAQRRARAAVRSADTYVLRPGSQGGPLSPSEVASTPWTAPALINVPEALPDAQQGLPATDAGLPVLLVSFSMPARTLRELAQQAARTDVTLVFRGLVNDSYPETVSRLTQVLGNQPDARSSFAIDPTLFSRFDVEAVPTLVLPATQMQPCQASCPESDYVKISGEATLEYLFERIGRESKSAATRDHARALAKRAAGGAH